MAKAVGSTDAWPPDAMLIIWIDAFTAAWNLAANVLVPLSGYSLDISSGGECRPSW